VKRGSLFFMFALFPLIPVSSTFAYGIVLTVALIWFFLAGLLFRRLSALTQSGQAAPIVELVCLAGAASLFIEILKALSPILAVTLSFHVILSAFTFALLVSIERFFGTDILHSPILRFVPFFLAFSALRELLSFGSLSIPVREGIRAFPILPNFDFYRLGFWGTTGGALVLLGFIAWFTKYLNRRLAAYRRNAQ